MAENYTTPLIIRILLLEWLSLKAKHYMLATVMSSYFLMILLMALGVI